LFFFLLGSQTLLKIVKILHYCPISPCFQHIAPLHAPLSGSLARQPCPAALPGSLARQPCPAAFQKIRPASFSYAEGLKLNAALHSFSEGRQFIACFIFTAVGRHAALHTPKLTVKTRHFMRF
jgi:hypothetical protein